MQKNYVPCDPVNDSIHARLAKLEAYIAEVTAPLAVEEGEKLPDVPVVPPVE